MNNLVLPLLSTFFVGLGATLSFDLCTQFLKIVFNIPPSNICLVGRWVLYMPEGIFKHSNIASTPKKKNECIAGWIAHYIIGVTMSAAFIFLVGNNWLKNPEFIPAIIFGIVSVLAPFSIMQPLFGLGFASSKSQNPLQSRIRSLLNHTAFGIGLYISALLIR